MRHSTVTALAVVGLTSLSLMAPRPAGAQAASAQASAPPAAATPGEPLPAYLRDRGTGLPTSMFGTYVRKGELLVYPFFEGYVDRNLEYKPSELGYGLDVDYRGRYRAAEGLFFVGYGITDWLAVEGEAAIIRARLERDPTDRSAFPAALTEAGLGDVEGQVRVRLARETDGRPEVFGFVEGVAPHAASRYLIGTPSLELKMGGGIIKGTGRGTFTVRAATAYTKGEGQIEPGEYAVEYLRRLSPKWRVFVGVEGDQDEVGLITEIQWHRSDRMFVRFNSGFGLTSKATDWAPEVGLVWSFQTRRTR